VPTLSLVSIWVIVRCDNDLVSIHLAGPAVFPQLGLESPLGRLVT
jgi:hypothetical protein